MNQRIAEGRARADHHQVHLHVIAPSKNIPATWILSYKPEQTDYLIRLGYEDAKRTLGQHDDE